MEINIKLVNGHWTVNGKRISEMDSMELNILNRFFEENKNRFNQL